MILGKWPDRAFSLAFALIFIGFVNSVTAQSIYVGVIALGVIALGGILAIAGFGVGSYLLAAWKPRRSGAPRGPEAPPVIEKAECGG